VLIQQPNSSGLCIVQKPKATKAKSLPNPLFQAEYSQRLK
ncbi:44633_t:CDS:1, partial [Gigaspora margarita]